VKVKGEVKGRAEAEADAGSGPTSNGGRCNASYSTSDIRRDGGPNAETGSQNRKLKTQNQNPEPRATRVALFAALEADICASRRESSIT